MLTRNIVRNVLGLGLVALLLGACQVIAGIEEREIDPAIASGKQCSDYCTLVMDVCTGKDAVYKTREQCLGFCSKLDPGDGQEVESPNTVDCRIREADIAKLEPGDHCKAAGPGGNGVCGTDCDAYCTVYPLVCPDDYLYKSKADCVQACSGLLDQDRYNIVSDHEGDSIECRLVHTSSASVSPKDAMDHCPHATIVPAEPWCTGKAEAMPSCESYCQIELAACTGPLKQYEDSAQCLAACAVFDLGTNDDEAGNNIGCRRYHSFSATLAPETHCYHSGPSGDGHCGDHGKVADGHTGNCESYCALSAKACPVAFKTKLGDADTCMAECIKLPEAEPDSKYTLASAKKSKGLQCRTLHATRALADPTAAAECLSVFGEGDCK
jgi:hypothetical protein